MRLARINIDKQLRWGILRNGYRDLAAEEEPEKSLDVQDGDSDGFLAKGAAQISNFDDSRFRNHLHCYIVLNAMLTLLLCVTISLSIFGVLPWTMSGSQTCVRATSFYCISFTPIYSHSGFSDRPAAPVLESKAIKPHDVRINGTLWPGKNPSWSRKEIGDPEAEEVWESFEAVHTFPITRDDVIALGKDPDIVARFPDQDFGLGQEAYIATLDIQHKVHCLNELRKKAFADYGKEKRENGQESELWWIHLRHCMDIVTQDMFCHADADLITYQWVDTQPNPFPDFSVNRKCRNIGEVMQYREEHKVDKDKFLKLEKPRASQVPMEPEYYASMAGSILSVHANADESPVFGFWGSDLYPNGEGYGQLPKTD